MFINTIAVGPLLLVESCVTGGTARTVARCLRCHDDVDDAGDAEVVIAAALPAADVHCAVLAGARFASCTRGWRSDIFMICIWGDAMRCSYRDMTSKKDDAELQWLF